MTDIHGLVEVANEVYLAFYFVSIELTETEIILSDRTNGKKPLNMTIQLSEIDHLVVRTKGIESVSFTYDQVNYKFVEYGNQTIELFGTLLLQRLVLPRVLN